jgi:hypothetical protein
MMGDTIDAEDVSRASYEQELDYILSAISAHKMENIQRFLQQEGLAHSGKTKSELLDDLKGYVLAGRLQFGELVGLLDTIEGWGNQQIYLFDVAPELSTLWRDPVYARSEIAKAGFDRLFNASIPLVLPEIATLSTIQHSSSSIRFVWVERRVVKKREPGLDNLSATREPSALAETPDVKDGIVWHAYRIRNTRGIIVFEWNFDTSEAMLRIQRLESGRNYVGIRDMFVKQLEDIFRIRPLTAVRLARAVRKLVDSTDVRRLRMKFMSAQKGRIALIGADTNREMFEDPEIEGSRKAFSVDTTGLLGHFIWLQQHPNPSREMYTQIFGESDNDQRIGILAEHSEKDVRDVLSRIRKYCS